MQGSKVMHQSRAGTLTPEEPDELIAHVRVCGGAGWVTTGSTRKPQAIDIIGFIYGWSCVWNFLFDTLTLQLAVNHDRRDGANL
jgi:hypothetical protein